tara:strand:- start:146 stop:385 length:240 start_codon:yes stop_codon:yes gene_type:complete
LKAQNDTAQLGMGCADLALRGSVRIGSESSDIALLLQGNMFIARLPDATAVHSVPCYAPFLVVVSQAITVQVSGWRFAS